MAVPNDPARPWDRIVIFDLPQGVEHRLPRRWISCPDRAVAKMLIAVDVGHDVGRQCDAGRAAALLERIGPVDADAE